MIDAVIEELKTHQTQLDQDGVMVGVSRQALEELLAHVATSAQPAPIAGLEPVAWLMEWRTQPNSPMPKNDQPLYSAAQLEAHAAEQVRAEREVCASIIDARCAEVLSRQYSDDPPPTEFEQSVNTNLRLTAALLPDLSAAIRARGQS